MGQKRYMPVESMVMPRDQDVEQDDNKEQEKIYARQEWFDAWKKGNALLPQQEVGITSIVADEVLRGSKEDIKLFSQSEISSAQIENVRKLMDTMHKRTGREINVSDASIIDLWDSIRERTTEAIVYLNNEIKKRAEDPTSTLTTYSEHLKKMYSGDTSIRDEFFIEHKDDHYLQIVREGMAAIAEAIKSQEVRESLKNYKKTFHKTEEDEYGYPYERSSNLMNVVREKIKEGTIKRIPENIPEHFREIFVEFINL